MIVIIGGGLAGLAASYALTEKGEEVILFERGGELGGVTSSYHIDGYRIEEYYHHIFEGDREIQRLIGDLGLEDKLDWRKATTGYFVDGEVHPLNTPLEILRYPYLSLMDKAKLALLVLRSKTIGDVSDLDDVTAKEWILENAGSSVYENFFQPLLQGKFGDDMDQVSAAWLLGRVKIRSNRTTQGEKLGYLRGGFWQLIDVMAKQIEENGGKIHTNSDVQKIVTKNGFVKGVKVKELIDCDKVISTVPPSILAKILDTSLEELRDIQYQGTTCALFALKKSLMNVYWLNIKADVPFGAIIEHTNFVPLSDYREHLIYVVSYFHDPNDPGWQRSKGEIIDWYLDGLSSMFPHFNRDDVIWTRLTRSLQTAPIYEVGYRKKILPYSTSIEGLYLAGMFSMANYPERSMNGSIKAGFRCAEDVMEV
ncbi:MAG: NAD(P)/FAD-dependent oxidoreductase [Methanocellales archaeon]|nr:NAD(P)/FAD-dependent oxidoreductase [Methanocellales archaeon]